MRCAVCKTPAGEVELFEGIVPSGMIRICNSCSVEEGIPIITKPTENQLDRADRRYSVRERMEVLSGSRKITEISRDQAVVQGHLARLKMPEKKQTHKDVLDNYYWTLNMARRRKKMTISQAAKATGISEEILEGIEHGKIPEKFEEIFPKLESSFGIKLLKEHEAKVKFIRTRDEEEEILRAVRERMEGGEDETLSGKKKEKLEKISRGEMDFSRRKEWENVTLNDLVDMKRAREKKEREERERAKRDSLVGEEIDLELEEI